jgi:hypothetical protein
MTCSAIENTTREQRGGPIQCSFRAEAECKSGAPLYVSPEGAVNMIKSAALHSDAMAMSSAVAAGWLADKRCEDARLRIVDGCTLAETGARLCVSTVSAREKPQREAQPIIHRARMLWWVGGWTAIAEVL